MKTTWIVLGLALFASACTTTGPVNFETQMNRLDSPEANGKLLGVTVSAGTRSNRKATITKNYGYYLIRDSEPSFESVASSGVHASLGIVDRLDVALNGNADAADFWHLKFQFLGEPRSRTKQGNFSMSVLGGYGSTSKSASGDTGQICIFQNCPTSAVANYSLKVQEYELGLMAGYRFRDKILGYLSGTYQFIDYSGEQTPFTGVKSTFDEHGWNRLLHLGFIFYLYNEDAKVYDPGSETETRLRDARDSAFFFQLEGSAGPIRLKNTSSTQANGAVNFGVVF